MATRSQLKVLNSEFAENLVSLLPLFPTLNLMKSHPEDWQSSDLLVIEVPVLEFGKEAVHQALQRLAIRAKAQGPKVLLVVTPRSPTGTQQRRETSRGELSAERPIRRWNGWMGCPFQLTSVCSCEFPGNEKTTHLHYYVGATFLLPWEDPHHAWIPCAKPASRPSVAYSPLGAKQGLCGIIRYVSHVLKERLDGHIPRITRRCGGSR